MTDDTAWPVLAVAGAHGAAAVGDHTFRFFSVEHWTTETRLRFERTAAANAKPLARRYPDPEQVEVTVDGSPVEVLEVVGRGTGPRTVGEITTVPFDSGAQIVITIEAKDVTGTIHGRATLTRVDAEDSGARSDTRA